MTERETREQEAACDGLALAHSSVYVPFAPRAGGEVEAWGLSLSGRVEDRYLVWPTGKVTKIGAGELRA